VDLWPWLTAFAGLGSDQGRYGEDAVWGDSGRDLAGRIARGFMEIRSGDPDFLSGQLSFAAEAQFAQYRSKTAGQDLTATSCSRPSRWVMKSLRIANST